MRATRTSSLSSACALSGATLRVHMHVGDDGRRLGVGVVSERRSMFFGVGGHVVGIGAAAAVDNDPFFGGAVVVGVVVGVVVSIVVGAVVGVVFGVVVDTPRT